VRKIQARCFCPKHGRLSLDEIVIKNGIPVCSKCSAELQFGNVKPRFNTKK
jgi:ribosomal protein L37AE/L43A